MSVVTVRMVPYLFPKELPLPLSMRLEGVVERAVVVVMRLDASDWRPLKPVNEDSRMEASPMVAWVELAIEARMGDEGLREALGRSFVLTESCLRRGDCTGRGGVGLMIGT